MSLVLGVMIILNIVYNFPPIKIKERPPLEILIQIGYVLTAVFSMLINKVEMIPWQTMVYLCLFSFQAHIAGEIMDIEPDKLSGKQTTATWIGRKKTKYLMIIILVFETYILYTWFNDYFLAGILAFFCIWMVLDVMVLFKDNPYTQFQMKLFGFAINAFAFLTMAWVLISGNLLHPV